MPDLSPDVLHARLAGRDGNEAADARIEVWNDFNDALVAAASEVSSATVVDAGHAMSQVEHDVRQWINARLHGRGGLRTDATT